MRISTWLLCITMVFVTAAGLAADPPSDAQLPYYGPDFTLADVQGKQLGLKEMRGHIVVINFWAFWCDTWKEELPHLKELAKEQSERDFRLVAVSVDGTRLQEFLDRTKGDVGFPVLLDAGGNVSAQYKVAHVPTVIVLDGDRRIRYTRSGYPGNEAIRTVLRKLRSEKKTKLVNHRGTVYSGLAHQ